jgi:hypothetical protein
MVVTCNFKVVIDVVVLYRKYIYFTHEEANAYSKYAILLSPLGGYLAVILRLSCS